MSQRGERRKGHRDHNRAQGCKRRHLVAYLALFAPFVVKLSTTKSTKNTKALLGFGLGLQGGEARLVEIVTAFSEASSESSGGGSLFMKPR